MSANFTRASLASARAEVAVKKGVPEGRSSRRLRASRCLHSSSNSRDFPFRKALAAKAGRRRPLPVGRQPRKGVGGAAVSAGTGSLMVTGTLASRKKMPKGGAAPPAGITGGPGEIVLSFGAPGIPGAPLPGPHRGMAAFAGAGVETAPPKGRPAPGAPDGAFTAGVPCADRHVRSGGAHYRPQSHLSHLLVR